MMDIERLAHLLDTYGADPRRWPDVEREAAQALLARSPEARARCAGAARLDALLDAVPAPAPSPALAARILAAAPAPRPAGVRRHTWRYVAAAVPLAAAAGLAIWFVSAGAPERGAPRQYAIADLGVYAAPTDVLLGPPDVASVYNLPQLGCDESDLGCPKLNLPPRESRSGGPGRMNA